MPKTCLTLVLSVLAQIIAAQGDFSINKITLRAKNGTLVSEWYINHLEFEKLEQKENTTKLQKNDFILEVVEMEDAVLLDSVKLENGVQFISGIYKFGFVTNNLDSIYSIAKSKKLRLAGGIINDEQLKCRSFITIDPEGNYIQFFESTGVFSKMETNGVSPAFLMIITDDYERTMKWYSQHGFSETSNNDNSKRKIWQRTIFNGKTLIEISEIEGKVATKEEYEELFKTMTGIISIGFTGQSNHENFIFDDSGNKIEFLRK